MLTVQGGVCALCGRKPSPKRRLDIDHDHKKMVVRGLCCFRCNRGMPFWMTPEWCIAAAKYLSTPPINKSQVDFEQNASQNR